MTLSNASFKLILSGAHSEVVGATTKEIDVPSSASFTGILADGTASGQGNKIASITGTLAAATQTSFDLNNLTSASVTDPLAFTKVKAMLIQNLTTSPAALQIGDVAGSTSNAWTNFITSDGVITLDIGGAMAIFNPTNGIAVASGNKLLFLKSSGLAKYQIDLIGVG